MKTLNDEKLFPVNNGIVRLEYIIRSNNNYKMKFFL